MPAYYYILTATAGRSRAYADVTDGELTAAVSACEATGTSHNAAYGGDAAYKAFPAGQDAIVTISFLDVYAYRLVEAGDARGLAGFAAKKAALDTAGLTGGGSTYPDQWATSTTHVARMTGAQLSDWVSGIVTWATARKAAHPGVVKADVPPAVLAAIGNRCVSALVTEARRRQLTVQGVNLTTAYNDLTNYGITYGRDLDVRDGVIRAGWPAVGAPF